MLADQGLKLLTRIEFSSVTVTVKSELSLVMIMLIFCANLCIVIKSVSRVKSRRD